MRISQCCLVLMSVALFGCASGMEELVAEGNWTEIGYRDGIKGQHSRTRGDLSEFGQVDQAAYDAGYLEGILDFCNPSAAYQIGLSGQYYEGVCEGTESGQKFRMEWQRGWNASR